MITLVGYWRSSCSWRVRLALAHKGIAYVHKSIDLKAGEQLKTNYRAQNPMAQVPLLVLEDGTMLSQSMAIIEYLDERFPQVALWPKHDVKRAQARAYAELINVGIQPLQNLSVLKRVSLLNGNAQGWAREVISEGLDALEAMISMQPGPFIMGENITAPDLLVVPQLYNARRFGCDTTRWPRLVAAETATLQRKALLRTHPDHQSDANPEAA